MSLDLDELEQLRPRLVNYFRVSCGDDAEDVVAEALADVAQRITHGDATTPAWAWQACRWKAGTLFRERQRRREAGDAELAKLAAPLHDPTAAVEAADALELLSPMAEAVIRLTADGHSEPEVGERLGLNRNQVHSIMRNARAKVARDRPRTVYEKLDQAEMELDRMARLLDLLAVLARKEARP